MKLIMTTATIAFISAAAGAAIAGTHPTLIGKTPTSATTAHSDSGTQGSHGEGFIYGGFGPYNDSR
jgi:hypothetical protein